MLLIWLLLPAASAIMDCKTACDICHTGSNANMLVSCSLCRECRWSMKRRMMQLNLPNKQKLLVEGQVKSVDQQKTELKDLEKKAFKQILQEYGWKPQDLDQTAEENVKDNDEDCLPLPKNCLHETNENVDKDKNDDKSKKKLMQLLSNIKCPVVPQTECPTSSVTPRTCPPIIPCEKKDKLSWHGVGTSSTMPPYKRRQLYLRQLARLDADYTDDMGCPTQPMCSDEEFDYPEPLYNRHPIRPPPLTSSTTCPDITCKETSTSQIITCAPCTPSCPLPCGPAFPPPFLPSFRPPFPSPLPLPFPPVGNAFPLPPAFSPPIPQVPLIQAPMTLQATIQYTDDDGQEELLLKEEFTKTTKDYVYLYVGIPKDVKKLRRG